MAEAVAGAITPESLKAKADLIRARQEGDAGVTGIEGELKTETIEAQCESCPNTFSRTRLLLDKREPALFVQRKCPECVEKQQREAAELEARQSIHAGRVEAGNKSAAFNSILENAGGNPWEHGHASLDNFDTGDAGPKPLGSAREFAAAVKAAGKYDPVRGLYLHGETGPGKTHLAVGVVRWLIENDYPPGQIVFDHAAELVARIQDTYGKKEASTFDVLERRFTAGLWILDDFGTERASDDVVRHMTLIFARRAMRPTLVTSNFSPARLDKDRPELMRVLSRLGPAYFRTVEVKGRDRRFD